MQDTREFEAKMRVISELKSVDRNNKSIDASSSKSYNRRLLEEQLLQSHDDRAVDDYNLDRY